MFLPGGRWKPLYGKREMRTGASCSRGPSKLLLVQSATVFLLGEVDNVRFQIDCLCGCLKKAKHRMQHITRKHFLLSCQHICQGFSSFDFTWIDEILTSFKTPKTQFCTCTPQFATLTPTQFVYGLLICFARYVIIFKSVLTDSILNRGHNVSRGLSFELKLQ